MDEPDALAEKTKSAKDVLESFEDDDNEGR